MNILVTGANGFIGSTLVESLLADGHRVRCLVRPQSNLGWLQTSAIDLVKGDLLNPTSLPPAVRDCQVVFHLAGVTRGRREQDFSQGNHQATRNLIKVMERDGPSGQALYFVSSLAAAGPCARKSGLVEKDEAHPVSAYGRSKLAAEKEVLAQAGRRPIIILRPPVVYGPRDKNFLPLFKAIKLGLVPLAGRRGFPLSLIYIDDLIQALLLCLNRAPQGSPLYFVNDGCAYEWRAVVQAAARCLNKKIMLVPVPLPLVAFISHINGLFNHLRRELDYMGPDKWQEIKQAGWLSSNKLAVAELGFSPQVDLEKGMRATSLWCQEAGWV